MFGYEFVTLDEDQKHARRVLLEYYPQIAQWSALLIFAGFQISFFSSWLTRQILDQEPPKSPSLDKRGGKGSWLRKSRTFSAKVSWWMKKDVINGWGTRGEWILGGLWTAWLLYLSIAETGNDYLHLTKRFGIIGASQLPMHYLLAMRSPYSPVQYLTRRSHEELKAAHQVLGRIVFLFFALHAAFYLTFFVLSGFLAKRIKDRDVILGVISILLFSTLSTTALGQIRRWNYRVFYISHVAIANLIVIPLFFHVTHIRLYIYETVVIIILHLVFRTRSLKVYSGTVKLLPGTNLVQVRIPLRAGDSGQMALLWKPGQHVYLSRPSGQSYSPAIYDQFALRNQTNPFTVASIPLTDKALLFVARVLNGNTRHLAKLAQSLSSSGNEVTNIPIALEGPYGASTRLPDFSDFGRVLLVAGGVGATFVLPVYRSIMERQYPDNLERPHTRFIWAVRKLAEAQWAFSSFPVSQAEDGEEASIVGGVAEVFVTRPSGPNLQDIDTGDDIELAEDDQLLSTEEQMVKPRKGMVVRTGRPDMPGIVNDVLGKGSRVAVISCGPKGMTDELSERVQQWIAKGHDVYWYNETFGW